jgi:hypothetical protein
MSAPLYFSNFVCIVPAKMKTTLTVAQFYLVYISLIYWKNLAGLRPAGSINKAVTLFCQHGAGEQQVTACAALAAGPPARGKLPVNIFFLKMNQPQTPQFAAGMQDKAGTLQHLADRSAQTREKSG